jgi:hypothetical protein
MLGLEHLRAQARPRRDLDLGEVELLGVPRLVLHLVVTFETGLVLGLARLGGAAHPVELVLEPLASLGVLRAWTSMRLALVSKYVV